MEKHIVVKSQIKAARLMVAEAATVSRQDLETTCKMAGLPCRLPARHLNDALRLALSRALRGQEKIELAEGEGSVVSANCHIDPLDKKSGLELKIDLHIQERGSDAYYSRVGTLEIRSGNPAFISDLGYSRIRDNQILDLCQDPGREARRLQSLALDTDIRKVFGDAMASLPAFLPGTKLAFTQDQKQVLESLKNVIGTLGMSNSVKLITFSLESDPETVEGIHSTILDLHLEKLEKIVSNLDQGKFTSLATIEKELISILEEGESLEQSLGIAMPEKWLTMLEGAQEKIELLRA